MNEKHEKEVKENLTEIEKLMQQLDTVCQGHYKTSNGMSMEISKLKQEATKSKEAYRSEIDAMCAEREKQRRTKEVDIMELNAII
jgi:hypothetical protein